MAHRWATALASAAVLVLAAACSGTPDPGADATMRPGPSAPAPTSATSTEPDEPQAPVIPDLAREKTTAGAEAFVRYYIEVLNYAHVIRSTNAFRGLAAKDCYVCTFLADAIDETHANGGHQEGGEWTASRFWQLPHDSVDDMNLLVEIHVARGVATRFEGDEETPIKEETLTYEFQLSWLHAAWAMHDVGPA